MEIYKTISVKIPLRIYQELLAQSCLENKSSDHLIVERLSTSLKAKDERAEFTAFLEELTMNCGTKSTCPILERAKSFLDEF